MMTHATNQRSCVNLTMIPVAEAPQRAATTSWHRSWMRRFDAVRLIQHTGTFLLVAALSAAAYLAINRYLVEVVQVVGVSMVPTLEEHGNYVLNRWALHNQDPRPQDIVVLRDPADNGLSVKRIIASAGDAVLLKNGKVFVNGKELAETYLPRGTHTYTYSQLKEQVIVCGKDRFFVLGDNRVKSIDSRSYGPVPRENILGLVVVK